MSFLYKATAVLALGTTAVSAWATALSQVKTNGASTLGLLDTANLPEFVSGATIDGYPWGVKTVNNTNPYDLSTTPFTGQTRVYDWVITNTTLAPDGVTVPMLLVNGQFPGPLIEANWGDEIVVTVTNHLSEGTAMHWHGFLQTGTPYYDGVPGVGQCPIAPGKSFTYKFRAELYGTTWWHSHWSAQYMNGLIGPMVIHGPTTAEYDIDIGPVMLSDWFHDYYRNLVEQVFVATPDGPVLPPQAQNMLINGKANYDCNNTALACVANAGLSKFRFTKGKKHLLRLINTSAEAIIFFSIDGYKMRVIANDFVPIKPYMTDLVTLSVGQRSDVIVFGKGKKTDAVWMRITEGPSGQNPAGGQAAAGTGGCSLNDNLSYETTAAIYYQNANVDVAPNTTSSIDSSRYIFPDACANQALNVTTPAYVIPVTEPDLTFTATVVGGYNSTGDFVWLINNVTNYVDYNDPLFLEAKLGNLNFTSERVVHNWSNYTTVRVIVYGVGFPASHPMHLHGHNMQILAEGLGTWDGTITHPHNPQRRDVQLMRPLGYLVVQWELNNPGIWPFHCHIAWHLSEGMNMNILEGEPDVLKMKVPNSIAQTCRQWSNYSNKTLVDQIDSGL